MNSMIKVIIFALLLGIPHLGYSEPADSKVKKTNFESSFKINVKEGDRLILLKKYKKALRAYKRAFVLKKHPFLFFNMGQCYRLMGNPMAAWLAYRKFLNVLPIAPNKAVVKALIKKLESKLEGELKIVSEPSGADIFLKTNSGLMNIGVTPLLVRLKIDTYKVVVSKSGYSSKEKDIILYRKILANLEFKLEKSYAVKVKKQDPVVKPEVVKVKKPVEPVKTKPDEVKIVSKHKKVENLVKLKPSSPWTSWWFIAGSSISGVLLASSGYMGISALDSKRMLDDTDNEKYYDDGKWFQDMADILLVGSLVTMGTVVIIALITGKDSMSVESPEEDSSGKTLLPFCTKSLCGLSLTMEF
jgi:PEGA domain